MRFYKPNKKYAIESCCISDNPPWKGWKVTRIFASAEDRDKTLKTLQKTGLSRLWLYRIKR
jgi:hypothetical protein